MKAGFWSAADSILDGDDAGHFLHRRRALGQEQRRVPRRIRRAAGDRRLVDGFGAGTGDDELAHGRRHAHHFVDPHPALSDETISMERRFAAAPVCCKLPS